MQEMQQHILEADRLELRPFFRDWLFTTSLEGLWEESFLLCYNIKGMTPDKIERMTHRERKWWITRLSKQIKAENDAMTKK